MFEFSATRKMVALEGRVQLFESAKKSYQNDANIGNCHTRDRPIHSNFEVMELTTLGTRRLRGYLIESF